jgi:hypothetical protein
MYRQTGSGFQEEWTRRHFVATGSLQYSRIISELGSLAAAAFTQYSVT